MIFIGLNFELAIKSLLQLTRWLMNSGLGRWTVFRFISSWSHNRSSGPFSTVLKSAITYNWIKCKFMQLNRKDQRVYCGLRGFEKIYWRHRFGLKFVPMCVSPQHIKERFRWIRFPKLAALSRTPNPSAPGTSGTLQRHPRACLKHFSQGGLEPTNYANTECNADRKWVI